MLSNQTQAWSAVAGPDWLQRCQDEFLDVLDRFAARTEPNRGTRRYYMNVPPAEPFLAPLEHPDIVAVCSGYLGPDFVLENLGSDTPLGTGSDYQPLHRDQQSFEEIHSLVVNIALSEQTLEHGPFEIIPGTMEADLKETKKRLKAGQEQVLQLALKRGDFMIRDPRTLHRGSPSRSSEPRPSLAYIFTKAKHSRIWGLQTKAISEEQATRLSPRAQEILAAIPRQQTPTPFVGYNSGEETIEQAAERLLSSTVMTFPSKNPFARL